MSKIFLDSPIGSRKWGCGKEKKILPFDYGEFVSFINPADNMGWDLIIVPSQSGGKRTKRDHNYEIVGIVMVSTKDEIIKNKNDWNPKPGNHKLIVAKNGDYNKKDVDIINNFFKNMWQFKDPKFF